MALLLAMVLPVTAETHFEEPRLHVSNRVPEPMDQAAGGNAASSLFAPDNRLAWAMVPFDAKKRSPLERAELLARLGFRHFAYDWRPEHVDTFDAEIEALAARGIELTAWWFPLDARDPLARKTLETFRRHGVHPELWVSLAIGLDSLPQSRAAWNALLPPDQKIPDDQTLRQMSNATRQKLMATIAALSARLQRESLPKTEADQAKWVEEAGNRVLQLARLAEPYDCPIALYKHSGWFGLMENQVAVIDWLRAHGVNDIRIAYSFSHARDSLHDDTRDFRSVWRQIQPYVSTVIVSGVGDAEGYLYPSTGKFELDMLRAIRDSGWKGQLGALAEKGGDAEITLGNYIRGLDWLAAELQQPGSAGPRPVFDP